MVLQEELIMKVRFDVVDAKKENLHLPENQEIVIMEVL